MFRLPRRDRGERRVVLAWAVAGVLVLWLLWQLLRYRGVMALLAEWQFDTFGEYHPFLTYVLLVLTMLSPLIGWSLVRSHRRVAADRDAAALEVDGVDEAQVVPSATPPSFALLRLVWASAAIATLSALIALMFAIAAPSSDRIPVPIDAAAIGLIPIATGPAAVTGRTLYARTAGFDENVLFVRHSSRFAPVIAAANANGEDAPLRLFVELPPDQRGTNPPAVGTRVGLIREGGLPGEVIRLYRYAGYDIGEPYYVLFSSRRSLQWPMLQFAGQSAALALLLAIGALAIHALRRRAAKNHRSGKALPSG